MNVKKFKRLFINFTEPTLIPFIFGLYRAISYLPHKIKMRIGRTMGLFIYYIASKPRKITAKNIQLCFPNLTPNEQESLVKRNFASLGMGLIEAGMAWFLPNHKLKHLYKIQGKEYIENALKENKGLLFLGLHMTTSELAGRLIASEYDYNVVFQPTKNTKINAFIEKKRKKFYQKIIPNSNARKIVKALRNKEMVWIALDQVPKTKHQVMAPFFNIETATSTALSTLSRLGDNPILIPCYSVRNHDYSGYTINFLPPMEDIPSGDSLQDAIKLNNFLESSIIKHPEQYLWQYKKFKSSIINGKTFSYD